MLGTKHTYTGTMTRQTADAGLPRPAATPCAALAALAVAVGTLAVLAAATPQATIVDWAPGDPEELRPPWLNREGGPVTTDPIAALLPTHAPAPPPRSALTAAAQPPRPSPPRSRGGAGSARSPYTYTWSGGFFATGNDVAQINVTSLQEAEAACNAAIQVSCATCYATRRRARHTAGLTAGGSQR